jgi:predicted O-linked N-acetylglucosamine transferase (SPINDLY family)
MLENLDALEINTISEKAYHYLVKNNYDQAIDLYEKLISSFPDNKLYYWYLGLALLLKEEEVEAQATWYLATANINIEEIESVTLELTEILQKEANRRQGIGEIQVAWAICQHIREISTQDINNLLQIVDLSIDLGSFSLTDLSELSINTLLQDLPSDQINLDLLIAIIKKIVKIIPLQLDFLEFFQVCLPHIYYQNSYEFMNILMPLIYQSAYDPNIGMFGSIDLCDVALKVAPEQSEIWRVLADFCVKTGQYERSFQAAKKSYSLASNLPQKIFDNSLIMRALLYAKGYDEEVLILLDLQKSLISALPEEKFINWDIVTATRIYNTTFYFSHTTDQPQINIKLRKEIAQFCQKNIEQFYADNIKRYESKRQVITSKNLRKPLKIGYISSCLKRHSVGWLARSLFTHHNRDDFQIHTYFLLAKNSNDPLTFWYEQQVDKSYRSGLDNSDQEVAEQINQDEIDILVELDSITFTGTCNIVAMKPASIQVTWLGWDASSIPTIDYYIADPYVLPEDAQEYYQETIWRLPQSYLAVDGFTIDVPTLKRHYLEIPDDAVVYFTSQMGHKYHPDNIRLQMKILYEVPNSYFIIKCFGESEKLQELLIKMAESEGISQERIKFIGAVILSETHRANLGIADIVLDTYPYNGATTTMETLWMGIPLVTKVGQQFAARNSYTMMVNAGITEGIAWTDEEYVEWGIRLGKDENLRRDISWKLKKGRQTAPLWDAKQFTKNMENAYQQMWQIYLDGGGK